MSYKVVDTRELLRKLEQEAEESRKERFKLEEKIFSFESTYLENTIPYGNCVLGWTEDGFEKAEQDTKENKVRKTSVEKIDQALRIFSGSSTTGDPSTHPNQKEDRRKSRKKN